jgi:DNA polymerase III subunit delta'
MGFDQFAGNEATVRHLREAIATERMPPALILAGPRGAGKYTLAIMLAQTMACLQHPVSDGLPDSAESAAIAPASRSLCHWKSG